MIMIIWVFGVKDQIPESQMNGRMTNSKSIVLAGPNWKKTLEISALGA